MTELLVDPHSLHIAPWPCDCGAQVQTISTYGGRTIRKKWRRCLGDCGRWFWSEDAVHHRMCRRCAPRADSGSSIAPQPAPPPPPEVSPPKPPLPRVQVFPVIVNGERFPSAAAAARHLGIGEVTMRERLRRGEPGYRYEDEPQGFRPLKEPPRAVICDGRRYASVEEAADAMQMSPHILLRWCKIGRRGWRFADEPATPAQPMLPRTRLVRPVIAEGIRYPSVRAAARALGVHPDRVGHRIAKGRPGYRYDD